MKVDLIAPHDPVSCAHRLKDAISDTLTPDTPKCVTGNGTEAHMTLWVHRPNLKNDMKTTLVASLSPSHGGTRIRGRIGPPISSILFFIGWFAFLSLFLLVDVFLFLVATPDNPWTFDIVWIGVPLFLMLVGLFILRVGRQHSRQDRAELLDFLRRTLGARERM